MNNIRKRNLDICKGVAILFIILTHVLQRSVPHYTEYWPASFFLVISVPVFFFVGGIEISYRKPLSPLGFLYDILKRALMYMWPFVLFLILRNAFYQQFKDFADGWSQYMEYPAWGLWVFWAFAWMNLFIDIGLLVSKLFPKFYKLIAPITLTIAFIVLICLRENNVIPSYHFLGYDYFVFYVPIFLVGYLIGDKLFSYYNKNVSFILMIFGFIATLMLTMFVKPFLSTGYHIEDNLYIYFLGAALVMAFHYGLSTLIENRKSGKIIGFAGRFTGEAYFLHLLLLKNWAAFNLNNIPLTILASLGLFLLCIVNTIAVVAVLYFIPFGHFLMFGKHYSIYKFENKFFDDIKAFCLK